MTPHVDHASRVHISTTVGLVPVDWFVVWGYGVSARWPHTYALKFVSKAAALVSLS